MRLLLSLVFLCAGAWAQDRLADLKLVETVALEGETHHVQGIVVDGTSLWVSSVD